MRATLLMILGLVASVVAEDTMYSAIELRFSEGDFPSKFDSEFIEFLESETDEDKALNRRIKKVVADLPNPQMVFINSEGKEAETLFVTYVPLSMVKDLIKEKKWGPSKAAGEEKKEKPGKTEDL